MGKNSEQTFKVIHPELEFDKNNLQDQELINYLEFLETKFKLKTQKEESDSEIRNAYNEEVT